MHTCRVGGSENTTQKIFPRGCQTFHTQANPPNKVRKALCAPIPHFAPQGWTAQRTGLAESVRASAARAPNGSACLALDAPTTPASPPSLGSFCPVCLRIVFCLAAL